ncbi:ankyrin repeat-containing protein ITN1 [Manihot esculenta]|uniref:Uncharacterized protein n=1 Tax=Manihot esculenta TaxID=3983 RepID=A0ACB7H2Q0_MANES|nr:ankyrin repeat-containing protein ITN1 [Manihot esculenta]KAG8646133.1 hypothetical protein MANES_10G125600v8 [Manihot esculenta]
MSIENLNTSIEHDQLVIYQASLKGDVAELDALLQQDELILDRVTVTSFHETPLHIAAMRGHLQFAQALLKWKPKLAEEFDSLCRLPLHFASAEGYSHIVRELVTVNPDACWARDQDGRIPLHLAAMKGRVTVIMELMSICPGSIREKMDNGETILHLCVKYNRLEALKLLVETVRDDEFVSAKDDNGNTILHLAAILKQVQIVKYLFSETSITENANTLNKNGFTALDALEHSPRDSKGLEIKIILLEAAAGLQRNKERINKSPSSTVQKNRGLVAITCKFWNNYLKNVGKRFEEARGNILVAATLTATIAFQAGVNPPQFNNDQKPIIDANAASAPSYLDHALQRTETYFWFSNTVSLALSLIIILVMFSGIPFKNTILQVFLVIVMCFTIVYISQAYFFAAAFNMRLRENWTSAGKTLFIINIIIHRLFQFIIWLHIASLFIWVVQKIYQSISKLISCLC